VDTSGQLLPDPCQDCRDIIHLGNGCTRGLARYVNLCSGHGYGGVASELCINVYTQEFSMTTTSDRNTAFDPEEWVEVIKRTPTSYVPPRHAWGSELPTGSAERKRIPIFSGFLDYFPLATAAVAQHSLEANEQHNPGTEMHWDRSKSGDEKDALCRHIIDYALDKDKKHLTAVAWRAMAWLEKELEDE